MNQGKDLKTARSRLNYPSFVWAVGMFSSLLMAGYTLLAYWMGNPLQIQRVVMFGLDFDWIFALFFIAIGALEFFAKPKTVRTVALILALRYVATAIFATFITYDQSIVHILWLILFITTGLIIGWTWMYLGELFMLITMMFTWINPGTRTSAVMMIDGAIASVIAIIVANFTLYLSQIDVVKLGVYNDLKNREAEQAERLAAIINSMSEAVINVSATGQVNLYNAAALSLLDTNKNISGQSINMLFNLVDDSNNAVNFAQILLGVTRDTERDDLTHIYENGDRINLDLSIAPVRDERGGKDQIRGYIIIARDITKQKSLDEQKDEFISVVSHELRTPVAIAEGSLSNLQLLIQRGGDPKLFANTLDAAHKNVLFLGQMVNDLGTLSRAQRGVMMDPEDIDVRDFANETYSKYLPEAKERGLTLTLECHVDGVIKVSRMAIGELLQNFVTNALKYTKEGGVTVHVKHVKTDDSAQKFVEFAVSDTGIGISESDQKHVFEKFWRSEDYRTRETSGTGLGLHVVQELARQLKIDIQLRSRLNHGSTFSFVLPLYPKDTPTSDDKTA